MQKLLVAEKNCYLIARAASEGIINFKLNCGTTVMHCTLCDGCGFHKFGKCAACHARGYIVNVNPSQR